MSWLQTPPHSLLLKNPCVVAVYRPPIPPLGCLFSFSFYGRRTGPHLHEQDLGRTIRDTGEREWGAHRDTEGGWAGFTHTTGSQGFLSRIGRVAPGGTGAGAGLLLVALS